MQASFLTTLGQGKDLTGARCLFTVHRRNGVNTEFPTNIIPLWVCVVVDSLGANRPKMMGIRQFMRLHQGQSLLYYLEDGAAKLCNTPPASGWYGGSGAEIQPPSCNHRPPPGIRHNESLPRWPLRSILDASGHFKASQPNSPWVSPTGGARLSGKITDSLV